MLVIILTGVHLAIHIPAVQNYVVHKVVDKLQSKIDGKIEFSNFTLTFINRVIIEDFSITGHKPVPDTLVSAEKLAVYISLKDIIQGDLRANRISIKNGIFNYIEEDGNKGSNLSRIFRMSNEKDTTKGAWPHITIKELRVQNYRFNYKAFYEHPIPYTPGCMDYDDIQVSEIYLRAHNLTTRPGEGIATKIYYLKAKEKSGLDLKNLTCDFTLDKDATTLWNLRLKENFSDVKANYLAFRYDSGQDLKDFVNKIILDVDFTDTRLDFRTVGIYTPTMQTNPWDIRITGRVYGPVAHFRSPLLKVRTVDNTTNFTVKDFSMKGLPDIRQTVFDTEIVELNTTSEAIDHIVGCFSGKPFKVVAPLAPLANISLRGNMLGTIYDFDADGLLSSSVGDVDFDVYALMGNKEKGVKIKGKVITDDVDLGTILKSKSLGKVSAGIRTDALIRGKEYGGMDIKLDSLSINRFGFLGYDYSNIFAIGKYTGNIIDGRLISHDPNFDVMLQGVADLSSDLAKKYQIHLDIPFIDLAALNLIRTEKKSQVSLFTQANLTSSGDEYLGHVDIRNVTYWGDEEYRFNSISLASTFHDDEYRMKLTAPFLDADYISSEPLTAFISRAKGILMENIHPETAAQTSFKLTTYNTESLFDIIMPDLYISDNTSLSVTLDKKDSLSLLFGSDRIALGNKSMKGASISLTNKDTAIIATIAGDVLEIGEMELNHPTIGLNAVNKVIDVKCKFDNTYQDKSHLDLNAQVWFDKGESGKLTTHIALDDSYASLKGHKWDFAPARISIAPKEFTLDNFHLSNGEQYISIHGAISERESDRVQVLLNKFDLGIIDSFMKSPINAEGTLTGDITASGLYSTPNILGDIKATGLSFMARSFGELQILSKWDQVQKRMNLLVMNRNEGLNPLTVSGYYQPNGKFVNLDISLKEFGLAIIEPFMKDILMNTGGVISGDIQVIGTTDRLTLSGTNTQIHNFAFTPVYTRVPYVVSGPVEFRRDGIYLQNLSVHDRFNHQGTLNGSLKHSGFKNMYLDATLAFNGLECLNTQEKDNTSFYGSAFASGNISLSGPFDDLFADVTATTGARTAIHIPLSSASSAKSEDLLTFTKREAVKIDPYLERLKKKNIIKEEKKGKANFAIQAKANVTSDAELHIEINKELGDILKCRGNGAVDINIDPSRSVMDLKGDYTIDEGSYKFVLLGITAKDFIIDNGGSINFNGDVKNTSLNVGATYQTKASISTLISDTSAVGNRRTVDCGIKMSGSLSDPNISFSVDVQDLDPITKGRVESALSTDDKIQKQFMALLISGSFVPDEQSGIVNNTTILYSNAGEMLSNQFNNVFRQLDIPLDLGFNFQPASDGKTHDMFDVALSYQAFNNRVIINGNVGNNQTSQAWGGDFEAEVKLDKKGKMRFKAFTRSADDYSNYLDNTQRHGLGFTFQDEFDSFRELLRNIFWSKQRREEYETQMILEAEKAIEVEEKANTTKKQIQQARESEFSFY